MEQFGNYRIIQKLASGGMAEVYLGLGTGNGGFEKLFAIKKLLPEYASNEEFVTMFRDEANICKNLQHANIVQVIGFEAMANNFALVMEYIQGVDLHQLVQGCRKAGIYLEIPFAVYVIREAARGLYFAHTRQDPMTNQFLGIVHRDISPSNVLINFEGEVKVSDFGIAKTQTKENETRSGMIKGKFAYMSPEHIRGEALDPRSDIFALGTVLWEILTNQQLFKGSNEAEVIHQVAHAQIKNPIRSLRSDIPENLEQIILGCLGRERENRFQSALDLEQALSSFLNVHYPAFVPSIFGNYLKTVMQDDYVRTKTIVQQTLANSAIMTQAATGPRDKTTFVDGSALPIGQIVARGLDLDLPQNENSEFVLSRKMLSKSQTMAKPEFVLRPPTNSEQKNNSPYRTRNTGQYPVSGGSAFWKYALLVFVLGFCITAVYKFQSVKRSVTAKPLPTKNLIQPK